MGRRMRHAIAALGVACAAAVAVAAADRGLSLPADAVVAPEEISLLNKIANFMWQTDGNSYQHVWPPMEFGWKMVLGSLIGFFGASFGSVGGVGGGGIFVPMLTLIIGFDPKSSTAISKCEDPTLSFGPFLLLCLPALKATLLTVPPPKNLVQYAVL